jgi:enoyl-CoA hydratase/carnithine racemase
LNGHKKIAGNLINTLLSYPKPIISVVNGLAFGGGMELNIFFDIIIASEKSIF